MSSFLLLRLGHLLKVCTWGSILHISPFLGLIRNLQKSDLWNPEDRLHSVLPQLVASDFQRSYFTLSRLWSRNCLPSVICTSGYSIFGSFLVTHERNPFLVFNLLGRDAELCAAVFQSYYLLVPPAKSAWEGHKGRSAESCQVVWKFLARRLPAEEEEEATGYLVRLGCPREI